MRTGVPPSGLVGSDAVHMAYSDAGSVAAVGSAYIDSYLALDDGDGSQEFLLTGVGQDPDMGSYLTAQDVAFEDDGDIFAVGSWYSSSPSLQRRAFLAKVDSEGVEIWTRFVSSVDDVDGYAVSVAPNGDVLVAGKTLGDVGGSDGTANLFVARFGAGGDPIWAQQLGRYCDPTIPFTASSYRETTPRTGSAAAGASRIASYFARPSSRNTTNGVCTNRIASHHTDQFRT